MCCATATLGQADGIVSGAHEGLGCALSALLHKVRINVHHQFQQVVIARRRVAKIGIQTGFTLPIEVCVQPDELTFSSGMGTRLVKLGMTQVGFVALCVWWESVPVLSQAHGQLLPCRDCHTPCPKEASRSGETDLRHRRNPSRIEHNGTMKLVRSLSLFMGPSSPPRVTLWKPGFTLQ